MNLPVVCAIVLNWNGTNDTLTCLQSLSDLSVPVATIVLVDNASTDNPRERFLSWANSTYPAETVFSDERQWRNVPESGIPSFVFIQNKNNFGYAGGNNAGIKYAMSAKIYDFVWVLNNDTIICPDALEKLVEYSAFNPEASIIGSTIVYYSQQDKVQCAGGCRYNPWTTTYSPLCSDRSLDRVLNLTYFPKIDYVYGASMFVRTAVFEACGMFNDEYFLFYEEIDLCKKAQKAGYKIAWCRDSIICHKVGQSKGFSSSCNCRQVSFNNYHESLSTLIYSKTFNPLIFLFSIIFRFFGKIAVLVKRGELYLIKPLLRAYIDFFMQRNQRGKYHNRKCYCKSRIG